MFVGSGVVNVYIRYSGVFVVSRIGFVVEVRYGVDVVGVRKIRVSMSILEIRREGRG